MNITEKLLTNNRPGTKIYPRAVVVHWTANLNKGADALANRNYFQNTDRKASCHYIVDDKQIIRCIPEDEMAYHVGAKKYKLQAKAVLGSNPNGITIGIEMCANSDGNGHKTYWNTVRLVADILKRYKWTTSRIWRHYDITGKECPKPLIDNTKWKQFLKDVEEVTMGSLTKEIIRTCGVIITKLVQGEDIRPQIKWVQELFGKYLEGEK